MDADIAHPSTSPWASPVVMVKKADGSWRMCVDYRRVNKASRFDCFPLPRLDEAIDAFAGAVVLSSLDLAMANHQVPVAPSDIEKTAFITHAGLYEMLKMPFGICNAPSAYQRLMSIVLRGLIARICLAYLDDVIVYSRRLSQHLDDLRAVFERLRVAGLKLKPSKCQLFRAKVFYLGHLINKSDIAPDPSKLHVLATWPIPETARCAVVPRLCELEWRLHSRYDATYCVALCPRCRSQRHRKCCSRHREARRFQLPQAGSMRSPPASSPLPEQTVYCSDRCLKDFCRRSAPPETRRWS